MDKPDEEGRTSEDDASRLRLEALRLFEQHRDKVTLKGSGVLLRTLGPIPLLRMAFYTVLKRYNNAIAENLIRLYRHECSLRAWTSVLTDMGIPEDVMRPLFWDHVEPVLFMALDLSGAIKEQVIRAAVSLAEIAHDGEFGLDKVTSWDSARGFGWIKRFDALEDGSDEFFTLKDAVNQLWYPAEAEELRDDHGRRHHAVAQRLGVGYPRVVNTTTQESTGLSFAFGHDKPLDLAEKIELIETQRLRAERAYDALWRYVDYLERSGLEA